MVELTSTNPAPDAGSSLKTDAPAGPTQYPGNTASSASTDQWMFMELVSEYWTPVTHPLILAVHFVGSGKYSPTIDAVPPEPSSPESQNSIEQDGAAQSGLLRDIDAMLSRLETNIAKERVATDALLSRLRDRLPKTAE